MPKPCTTLAGVHRALSLKGSLALSGLMTTLVAGCSGGASTSSTAPTAGTASAGTTTATPTAPAAGTLATRLSVGEAIFNDTTLSASGRQACTSCHAKPHGRADPTGTALPMDSPLLDRQGFRSSPSLMYLSDNRTFGLRADGSAVGGFTWDGRANRRQTQASGPLLDATERAHASVADVAAKVRRASYFAHLSRLFGLRGNVIRSAPFGTGPGGRPCLSAQDVADIVAFLRTLSDDFAAPAASATVTR